MTKEEKDKILEGLYIVGKEKVKDLYVVDGYCLISWIDTKVRMIMKLNYDKKRKSDDWMNGKQGGKNIKAIAFDLLWEEMMKKVPTHKCATPKCVHLIMNNNAFCDHCILAIKLRKDPHWKY